MSSWRHKVALANRHQFRTPIPLEFTTTACNRPELLMITYSSFVKHLKGVDFAKSILYLNIDPMPNRDGAEIVEKVAKRFFGRVFVRYSEKGCASMANDWVLRQPKGEFFFNLEDDWELRRDVNIFEMISLLQKNKGLMQCYLLGSMIEQGRPTLMPSLMRRNVLITMLELLNVESNYEQQMIAVYNHIGKKSLSVQYAYGNGKFVHDIGRVWFTMKDLKRDDQHRWITPQAQIKHKKTQEKIQEKTSDSKYESKDKEIFLLDNTTQQ